MIKKFNLLLPLLLFVFAINASAQCGGGATITVDESRCEATGVISASNISGVGPFTFDFVSYPIDYAYTGPASSSVITALNPGNYVLRIIDAGAGNCFTDYNVTVPGTYVQPDMNTSTVNVTNCYNGTNGSITAALTDGRLPYNYEIIAGPMGVGTFSASGVFNNLMSGTYSVRGYDSCGNFQTRQVTIDNFYWSVNTPVVTKTACGQYSFDAISFTSGMTGVSYRVKDNNGNVLSTSPSLPISFSHADATIGAASVCVVDACGTEVCTNFTVADWGVTNESITYTACNQWTVHSITISGSPIGPLTYGYVRGTGDTVWSATPPPFTFGPQITEEYFWGFAVVKDGCGVVKKDPNTSGYFMVRVWPGVDNVTNTSCTEQSLTVGTWWNYIAPMQYSLNGGSFQSSNTFNNLTDGTYTVTAVDACGLTRSFTWTVSHTWDLGGYSEPRCNLGTFGNYISVNYHMKAPITFEQWDFNYTGMISSQVYTDPTNIFTPWYGNGDWYSSVEFSGLPNTNYQYIAIDDCGRRDTVTVWNGPNGHVPNTLTTSVTPLCVNKGNITANYTSDNPSWNSALLSLWNITTPGSPITNDLDMGNTIGTYTWNNIDTGTYVVRFKLEFCPEEIFDTVKIEKYVQPRLRKSIAFNCAGGTVQIVGSVKGGLPPYSYEIIQTFPTNNPQPPQASNIFTVPGTYTLVRLRVVDACGNTSLQDLAVRPPAAPIVKVAQKLPVCNMNMINFYVDSIFVAATYEWKNPAGIVIGTSPAVNMPVTIADTGLYTCRVLIPGTCYDDTAKFRIRAKDFNCVAQLGNYVWHDANQNGSQDPAEVGVAGVTVTLYDNANTIIAATVTDAYGYYKFDRLAPGTYHVGFSLPSNYVFTGANLTGDSLDSDPNPVTGLSGNYTLIAGDSNMTVDAGIYQPVPLTASLGDKVWNDLDQDGVQDPNELGISGVTVTLYDNSGNAIGTTVTDANGNYYFTGLTPGTYSVGFSKPIGYVFSPQDNGSDVFDSDVNPATGMTSQVTLTAGENNLTIDAGLYAQSPSTASLGNYVWNDVDNNGIQDDNERGVSNVTVTLYGPDGTTVIATTVTDEFGYYIFNNLTPGDYVVGFSNLPSGFVFAPQNNGGNDSKDNDADAGTGKTGIINLSAGEVDMSVDAGIHNSTLPNAALGNYVWFDYNLNGIQDANEIGVPGVTVTLYDNSNTVLGTTATDVNGFYMFNNLAAGTYRVGFSNLPLGYILTNSDQGGNDGVDSDPDKGTGLTSLVTLTNNEVNLTLDAGIIWGGGKNGTASLGDIVWNDANQNGIQDNGELGVPGVTVTLYEADGITVIESKVTDPLGNYLFTGLDAGSYVVGFSNIPAGYTFTSANQGSDDELDADADALSGGKTGVYALAEGEENLSVDAGIYQAPGLASLGNYVWNDLNQDGTQDPSEPGVPGVTVTLYNSADVLIGTTTTDANGAYQFTGLTPGNYYVEFSNLPSGYEFTGQDAGNDETVDSDADPVNGSTEWVTLVSGQNYPDLDAGIFTEQAGLGNFVWNDVNNNGLQDLGETGIPGITVTLYAADGVTPIATTITNANGAYSFVNLNPGSYIVGFSGIPVGANISSANEGSDDAIDSDADPVSGKTGLIVLAAGEYNPTIDAGINIPQGAGLGNYVWFDMNANGVQNSNEPGVAGVTVILYNEAGVAIQSAVTDQTGFYSFPNLSPGTYSVGFTNLPTNRGFTISNAGGDDGLDSDVEIITNLPNGLPTMGKTQPVTIVAGQYNPTLDAGLVVQFATASSMLQAEAILNGYTTKVTWITLNEKDVRNFDIQRSTDATSFETITNKEAKGNTIDKSTYSINDDVTSIIELPVIYYRVVMNDQDGQKSYSNIVSVRPLQSSDPIQIYPTPFKDKFTITYSSDEAGSVQVKLTDMLGKIVEIKKFDIQKGSNYLEINKLNTLSIGSYFVQIINDETGFTFMKKIQKK